MRWFRRTPLEATRWVVLDCETSGIDAARDRLLALGAVAVRGGRIALGDRFAALVAQETPSDAGNILIHGIGGDAQRGGRPLPEVLAALREYLAEGVPVAFHAPFDAAVLRNHGLRPAAEWVDLATLMPALFSGRRARTLDEWLAEFGIEPLERHDALGDALATAELLLVALKELKRGGADTVEAVRRTERDAKWLVRP